jgi:hypothetical protein
MRTGPDVRNSIFGFTPMLVFRRRNLAAFDSCCDGGWSLEPPPYRVAIVERDFVRLKEQWLYRTMRTSALAPSYRVVAYFLTDLLNWATMDCWMSHRFMAQLLSASDKTVQRALFAMEDIGAVSIWRLKGSSRPLRYAPVYLQAKTRDTTVGQSGHECSEQLDNAVHESFLSTQSISALSAAEAVKLSPAQNMHVQPHLSFKLAQRGKLEVEVARLIGGYDLLSRLAAVNEEIVNRLCEAQHRGIFEDRLIKATSLAAKQSRLT